jgi:hypothetical protein
MSKIFSKENWQGAKNHPKTETQKNPTTTTGA